VRAPTCGLPLAVDIRPDASGAAGFDLVGHEDSLNPLKYYLPTLLWFQDRQKEVELDVPFCFHAGETLGDGDSTDDNLYDAILLGTKRIGHGFSLAKHPRLMELCRERGIALEVRHAPSRPRKLVDVLTDRPLLDRSTAGLPVQ
jgi:adenosine deaminase CECR1